METTEDILNNIATLKECSITSDLTKILFLMAKKIDSLENELKEHKLFDHG